MFRHLRNTYVEKAALDKIAASPANRILKYIALAFALIAIVLLMIMIIWLDSFSLTTIFSLKRLCRALRNNIYNIRSDLLIPGQLLIP